MHAHRIMASPGGKYCKSLQRSVWRGVVSPLKKQCLWTQNAAFRRDFICSGGDLVTLGSAAITTLCRFLTTIEGMYWILYVLLSCHNPHAQRWSWPSVVTHHVITTKKLKWAPTFIPKFAPLYSRPFLYVDHCVNSVAINFTLNLTQGVFIDRLYRINHTETWNFNAQGKMRHSMPKDTSF